MAKRFLFIDGKLIQERACLGWQDYNSSLYGLKTGYLNAANELVESALQKGSKGNIKVLDTYVFPVLFLYRHSIEISIKAIYFRCFNEIANGQHDLIILWDKLRQDVIEKIEDPIFIEKVKEYKENIHKYSFSDIDLKEIRNMIIEINKTDKKSDAFRYLMNKNKELYFTTRKFIDYPNLKKNFNYLFEIMDYIYFVVDEYLSS